MANIIVGAVIAAIIILAAISVLRKRKRGGCNCDGGCGGCSHDCH